MRRLLLLTLGALYASGCAGGIRDVEAPGDQPVVFGRILASEDGRRLDGIDLLRNEEFRLIVLPDGSSSASDYLPDEDGVFCWALVPGGYSIAGFFRAFGASKVSTGRIGFGFRVPQESGPVYIGDLVIEFSRGSYTLRVDDALGSATHPCGLGTRVVKQLMAPVGEPGSFRETLPICNGFWGDTCGRRNAGVIPISPRASTSFPPLSTLTPRLQWQPAGNGTFSYDVVVYEAASWVLNGIQRHQFPGHVAVYAENVAQPSLALTTPLEPDTRYYWSVRLRDGDRVSTWSSHGYFDFYLVGFSSAYNQPFTFTTP